MTIQSTVPKKTRTALRKKAIESASSHLGVTEYSVQKLSVMAAPLYEETFASLLELLSQPATSGNLVQEMLNRHASSMITFVNVATWIKNANLYYYDINTMVSSYFGEEMANLLTSQIIEGLHHYSGTAYTNQQVMDYASVIAAAAFVCTDPKREVIQGSSEVRDIYSTQCKTSNRCTHLDTILMSLVVESHETAEEIVRVIVEESITSEAHLLHRLGGGPRALSIGAL